MHAKIRHEADQRERKRERERFSSPRDGDENRKKRTSSKTQAVSFFVFLFSSLQRFFHNETRENEGEGINFHRRELQVRAINHRMWILRLVRGLATSRNREISFFFFSSLCWCSDRATISNDDGKARKERRRKRKKKEKREGEGEMRRPERSSF